MPRVFPSASVNHKGLSLSIKIVIPHGFLFNRGMMDAQKWQAQKTYFQSGQTHPLKTRQQNLKRLRLMLEQREQDIYRALFKDLGKPEFETYSSELGFLLQEIRHTERHLRCWMRPQQKLPALALWPARAQIQYFPKGQVLILSPWNYPLQLALSPLIPALAAGNVVVLKPSESAPATTRLLKDMLGEIFAPELVTVCEGNTDVAQALIELPFQHILFTGSPRVGRIVMEKASRHLTPVTLELGGKSPAIIDETADLNVAARRLAWGKFFNTGQTCIAPDYALVHEKIFQPFINALRSCLHEFYGKSPETSPDYGRINNERHFDRLVSTLKTGKILYGGATNRSKLFISPTLMTEVQADSPLLTEEIFGPILPLIPIKDRNDIFECVERHSHPLALYLFSRDNEFIERVLNHIPCGGVTINDTLLHGAMASLPFGGVGSSGMGRYRGFEGFKTFSNMKSIVRRPFWGDLPLRYPPYMGKLSWLRRLF